MNIRKVDNYAVGLDIGTNSVGWAVVDDKGELLKFKGKNTWGSRLFDSADTAARTRAYRTQRRRYDRRKYRISLLRKLMETDVFALDENFYHRMEQSYLWHDDRDFNEKWVLFNDANFDEKKYYETFRTIYHLRDALVNTHEKMDIRLIYLALHHMIKYRGNFLREGDLTAADSNITAALGEFQIQLMDYCERYGIVCGTVDLVAMAFAIQSGSEKRAFRAEKVQSALGFTGEWKNIGKQLSRAMFGYEVNYASFFEVEGTEAKFALDAEEKVEKFVDEVLPEDDAPFFESLRSIFNAYLLAGILKDIPEGKTISYGMVGKYEQHKNDLDTLKTLVKKYVPGRYDEVFRGAKYADGAYKRENAEGYTAYILSEKKLSKENFYKYLKSIFADSEMLPEDADIWVTVEAAMEEGNYLSKLRTRENGAIPHQLHLEEMRKIIENQGEYWPTLRENQEKIEAILTHRIPYYVGPLGKNGVPNRKEPFTWAIRVEGQEDTKVTPWNFDKVIDKDASAELFIRRMTGKCSYLLGKDVIPRNSLLYSEFCVRQELNVCTIARDGERPVRFDCADIDRIFNEVFKKQKRVKVDMLRDWIRTNLGYMNNVIQGTQKEGEFASSLTSYCDFTRILGHEPESISDREMVEQLITWITIFEDKKILKRKIEQKYGTLGQDIFDKEQIKQICKLRYTGWSKLSRDLLEGLKADYNGHRVSIIGILRDPEGARPQNLMEILADERFGFSALVEAENQEYLSNVRGAYELENIPGSPAIKRGINQSLKIVDEIVSIAGHTPKKICVEIAREEQGKGKGSRTKTRYQMLQNAYDSLSDELKDADISDLSIKLKERSSELDKEKVFLYFLQMGKCMYCGKSFDISSLNDYHVDHIVPQSFIKDDSLDNKVLVCRHCNEEKLDTYPIPESIRRRNLRLWQAMQKADLISKRKLDNLLREDLNNRQIEKFINRQLVETRQITKHVIELLKTRYPDATVEAVKAELTHDLRVEYDFPKSRVINDYHHAHDAYLACCISRYVSIRYPSWEKELDYSAFKKFSGSEKGQRKGCKGFIVGTFSMNGFDKETGEIFRDIWDADEELLKMHRCLTYKDCFISRKTEELTGEFWNATVYSRRVETDKAIPLKKNSDPKKYGYYQSPNSAYYCLVTYTETVRSKAKTVARLVGVPVNVARHVSASGDLRTWLDTQYADVVIIKPKIMKYQKISWAGCEYYLTSNSEMINARQLWLPESYVVGLVECEHAIKKGQIDLAVYDETFIKIYERVIDTTAAAYPRYSGLLQKIEHVSDSFYSASIEDKLSRINELLGLLHANAGCGLVTNGLTPAAGRMMNINYGPAMLEGEIEFIDTSITGMYERRYSLGV